MLTPQAEIHGEMVERVAWAILQALHSTVPEDQRPQGWSDVRGDHEERIIDAAKAAIKAMRDPSKEQANVMRAAFSGEAPPTRRWEWVWQTMIDAVLS